MGDGVTMNFILLFLLPPALVASTTPPDPPPVESSQLNEHSASVFSQQATVHHYSHELLLCVDFQIPTLAKGIREITKSAHLIPPSVQVLVNKSDTATLPLLEAVLSTIITEHNHFVNTAKVDGHIRTDVTQEASRNLLEQMSEATGIAIRSKRSTTTWQRFLQALALDSLTSLPESDDDLVHFNDTFVPDHMDLDNLAEELLLTDLTDNQLNHTATKPHSFPSLNSSDIANQTALLEQWFPSESGENLLFEEPPTTTITRVKRTPDPTTLDPFDLSNLTEEQVTTTLQDKQTLPVLLSKNCLAIEPLIEEMAAAHDELGAVVATGDVDKMKIEIHKISKFIENNIEAPLLNFYEGAQDSLAGNKPLALLNPTQFDEDMSKLATLLQKTKYRLPATRIRQILSYQTMVKKDKYGKIMLFIR